MPTDWSKEQKKTRGSWALRPCTFENPRVPVAWKWGGRCPEGGGSWGATVPIVMQAWGAAGCVGVQQEASPSSPDFHRAVRTLRPQRPGSLGTMSNRGLCLSVAFLKEPSPKCLFPTRRIFTTVLVPIFQNVKIKGKSSVIAVHLLSKYTVIRVSYVVWQWMLDHPLVLSVPFLKAMGIPGARLSVFTALPQHLFQKQLKGLDWIPILNFQLTSKNV